VGELTAVPERQRGRDELAVAVVAGIAGFGGPDRVQDGQVVRVGQVPVPGFGSGKFGTVAAQDVSEHGCCPAFKTPMKAAFGVPMWWCVKAPLPCWLRGFGGGGAGGCG
jgi:hypothetical protein